MAQHITQIQTPALRYIALRKVPRKPLSEVVLKSLTPRATHTPTMDGDEKPMSSQRREQVLENCRWLFGQEVQLITFYHTFNNGVSNACTALILPKSCSLNPQSHSDFNSKILFKAECKAKGKKWVTREDAINNLLWAVESKMGEILQPDIKGEFHINKSAIPAAACGVKEKTETSAESQNETSRSPITLVEKDSEQRYELDGKTMRDERKSSSIRTKKIWRIAGYTSSGEACIEEHEPGEIVNLDSLPTYAVLGTQKTRLAAAKYAASNLETDFTVFTPETPVVGGGGTGTTTTNDDPGDSIANACEDAKRLNHVLVLAARAGVQLAELQSKRATATSENPATSIEKYQQLLDEQELAVQGFLHWVNEKNQRIASLESELREAQVSRDTEIRACAELQAQLEKESLRAGQSEAREMDTNELLERLFRSRGSSRSVKSGLGT